MKTVPLAEISAEHLAWLQERTAERRREWQAHAAQNMRAMNFEKLDEATDEQLAKAYAAALTKARDAPKESAGSMAWARFAREAARIGDEIARRKR